MHAKINMNKINIYFILSNKKVHFNERNDDINMYKFFGSLAITCGLQCLIITVYVITYVAQTPIQ